MEYGGLLPIYVIIVISKHGDNRRPPIGLLVWVMTSAVSSCVLYQRLIYPHHLLRAMIDKSYT